ncbi:hypothetical protein Tco_1524729 [Tanacetum coccineum]
MLQKQKFSDNDHYDLPLIYNVNDHTLHFGRREYWEYVKNIDLLSLIEDEVRFTSLSDSDSIRVCLLLSLEVIFMGHDLGSAVDDVFLRMVEDLEDWNDFPWGEHMWQELYAAIRNVNLNHKVTGHWWTKDSEGIPRGCFWSKHFPFQKWEYFGQLFPQDKKPNYELYPNRAEAQSEWFTRSSDYFKMYTPRAPPVEYGRLFGDYLKNLSLARTRREKDREPFIQSCPKVVSLNVRVKDLKGLCDSLMILPKEIKSLKARVYKLETIINYWSDQDGEPFFKFMGSTNPSANKDAVNDLVDALDDLVDENGVVEVDKNLSQDDFLKAQKLEAEKNRRD